MMRSRALWVLGLLLILVACKDPRSTIVPSDLQSWEHQPELKAAVEKLDEEEKRLFVAFAMRRALGSALGGEGIQPGTTVGGAIEAQRSWEAEQVLEKLKQEELAKRLEAESVESLREMNDALTVSLTSFEFIPSNARAGRFSDQFSLSIGLENHTRQDMIGVKGVVVFKDVFGDPIKRVRLSSDTTVPGEGTAIWEGTLDYNQFVDEDQRLRTTDRGKLGFEWIPDTYLYWDGSRLEMPSAR